MKATVSGVTTAYIRTQPSTGSGQAFFEWHIDTTDMVKYYYAGSQRLAMRVGWSPNTNLKWLVGDHASIKLSTSLGSTSLTFKADTYTTATHLYKPWGEVRYQSGTLPTKYTFTGQYSHTADFGLMFYVARWYDPVLGRFAQADSIVPGAGNPLAWDRYAYALNAPMRYTDPTGHFSKDQIISFFGVKNWSQVLVIFNNGLLKDRWGWLMVLRRAEIGDKIALSKGEKTITGYFALDPYGNLIIIFPEQDYYIDLVTAGLDGDSYTLTKEDNLLDDIFCSPMDCGLSEQEDVFQTEAVRGPIPFEHNEPSSVLPELDTPDFFNPRGPKPPAPKFTPGGAPGSPLDMNLMD